MSSTPKMDLPFLLKIGRNQPIAVGNLAEASITYQIERDRAGDGYRDFPEGRVYRDDRKCARISFNGRVWQARPWRTGDRPFLEAQ